MAIADTEIAQIRAATDIVALISEQVALKKAGRRWQGLCPFHTEKSPSFSVNAEDGVYYCFGCRASGDAITFVRETLRVDFREAVEILADRAGIEIHDDAATGPARKDRQELLDAMERAVEWYHQRLLTSPDAGAARQYLRSRGFTGDVVRQFRLGWAPDEWDAMSQALDLSTRVLTNTGLGFENSRGRRQDALRARVIFPIRRQRGPHDRSRRKDSAQRRRGPGRRAPATQVQELAGNTDLSEAQDSLRPARGQRRHHRQRRDHRLRGLHGRHRTVPGRAPAGRSDVRNGAERRAFRTLRNFARRIVLAYDADGAGQSAAASVYQWERQHDIEVAVVRLPAGADPGEMAQRDPDLLAAVALAVPFSEFRLERVLAQASLATPEGRARAADAAIAVVAEHPSDLVRDQYVRSVADRLRLDVDQLRPLLAQRRATPGAVPTPGSRTTATTSDRPWRPTRPGVAALSFLLHVPELAEGRFRAALFLDPDQRLVYEALEDGALVADALDDLERRDEYGAADVLRQIAASEGPEVSSLEEALTGALAQLVRAAATEALREIERDLRAGAVTAESAMEAIRDVKARLGELDSPRGSQALDELIEWLDAHDGHDSDAPGATE
jgi:DNA primase